MKLTPLDIKRQEFKKVMRGYDVIEVDAFLEMVADEYESLLR
ncbi:MAG: DivIVA domain-containing protein, partial [Candidatus Helarchaeota archaeon]|nr:DivIVA domain-containing protein [Candidatus Helarchaeota archaeon]